MKSLLVSLAVALALGTEAANLYVKTPTLVSTLAEGRNYCPTLEGVGEDGRFGILLQTKIWYHGRTGNARRFYQDQDESEWPTVSHEATDSR